jgi:hypothetical protein
LTRRLIWVLLGAVGLAAGVVVWLVVAIGDPSNPVAATLLDGRPALVVTLCEGEGVESVFLTDSRAQDGEGPIVWRIDAADGPVPEDTFVVGEVPAGFVEARRLEDNGVPQSEMTAWVRTSDVEMVTAVDFAQVEEGELYVDLKPVSREEFRKDRFCS